MMNSFMLAGVMVWINWRKERKKWKGGMNWKEREIKKKKKIWGDTEEGKDKCRKL